MAMDEPNGKNGNDDRLKKPRVACCACRSTKEHRCYKCFCGECPWFIKKLPPRYGHKEPFSDSRPPNSSSILGRYEETPVSDKVVMDTSAKKSVETSDLCTGDEHPPGFSSCPSALGSLSVIRSGAGGNGDEDRYCKAISPNSRVESGSSPSPSILKDQRGEAEVGNQKLVTNEVDDGSSKSHAGSTSVWEVLTDNKSKGNQEVSAKKDDSPSSWGLEPVREQIGHSAGSDSSWGARRVEEPRGKDEVGNQKLMMNEVDGGSSKLHDGSTSIWDVLATKEPKASGNQEGWGKKAGSVSRWSPCPVNDYLGSSGGRSARRVEEPRASGNQEGWGNKAGSVSGRGPGPVNERRGHSSGSFSGWTDKRVEEPRASGNQEGWGNKAGSVSGRGPGPVNERRGHSSGSYSGWTARRGEEPRERDAKAGSNRHWSTRNESETRRNAAGPVSRQVSQRVEESRVHTESETRRNAGGPVSRWGSRRVEESRGNEEKRANRSQERSLKPVSPTPHRENVSRWSSCSGKRSTRESEQLNKGNDERNQKLVTEEVNGGSFKSHAGSGSTSIWDTLAAKVRQASGNQVEWGNKVGLDSSWGAWSVNAPRGNAVKSFPSRDPRRRGEPRSDAENKEVTDKRAQDGSSERNSLAPHVETGSRWNSYSGKRSRDDQQRMTKEIEDVSSGQVKKPRGNQEIVTNTTKDGSSKPELLKTNVESGSVKQSGGNQDVMDSIGGDGSCKSVSYLSPSGPSSSSRVKNPREEAADNKAKDKTFTHIPGINPHAQSGSSSLPSESRGNLEIVSYRAGDESSEQVLHNLHADPRSSLEFVTAKKPRGNQEITANKTENGSPSTVLDDQNAGILSTPSSLTAKEPTGSVQDDQHDATIVPKNIEGVRENKKITDSAVDSPRHAKPLPVVISGKIRPSVKENFYNSGHLSPMQKFGPCKKIIWKGHFELLNFPTGNKVCEVYLAHMAAKVSDKAYRFACQIAGNLQFMMLPRSEFMPKIFTHDQPDNRDIALYFYPQKNERSRKEYAELLVRIEKRDLVLRSVMGQVELLVFTSKILHEKYQKLKGRHYYMWGVFRQLGSGEASCSSKVVPTPHQGPSQVIQNST